MVLKDPLKYKQLHKGVLQLCEEGATQVFRPLDGSAWIIGVVGQLQLDVLSARFSAEYSLQAGFEAAPFETARWIEADDEAEVKRFMDRERSAVAEDRDSALVYLARNAWELNYTKEKWPQIRLLATRERE